VIAEDERIQALKAQQAKMEANRHDLKRFLLFDDFRRRTRVPA
jgi:hypothetical protein